jgi:PAT family beta-lactamase induction signal transducer AmpG
MTNLYSTLKSIFTRYIFFELYLLSIISGLPFSVMYTSIILWLTESGVDLAVASSFGWVRMPYSFKYLWAPIIDYIKLPILYNFFGRRRSWMILTSVVNILILISIVNIPIIENIKFIWFLSLLFGFSAATYDIAYDALRIEKLDEGDQSIGAAVASFGYKSGAWISGAGVIFFVGIMHAWNNAFYLIASIFGLGILFILTVSNSKIENPAKNFVEAVKDPIMDILKKDNVILIILFIITFKGGQAMLNFMCMPFYRKLGYSMIDIGIVVKSFGFFMSLLGIAIGGIFIRVFGVYRGILYCGLFQAVTDFSFIWLNYQEGALWALYVNIILENVSGAMASCGLVTFISVLCNKQFAGSHFAIFSSLAVVMNSTMSGFAGSIVKAVGWDWFFFIDFAASIPPLFIIIYLGRKTNWGNASI